MLTEIRQKKKLQLLIGFVTGMLFGLFLYIGGVTEYDVIIGQLLLTDFTVVKVIMTAVAVGMIGIYIMKGKDLVTLHVRRGSIGSTVIGGLIFGVGFAVLGYCPGTAAGAVGHGAMDALFGGIVGLLIGTWIFAAAYPRLNEKILNKGEFKHMTIPEIFGTGPWFVVIPVVILIVLLLAGLQYMGF